MPVAVYFTSDDGQRHRVHDVSFVDRRHRAHAVGDPAAESRVFVTADGVRRIHRFKPREPRVLSDELLEQQLRQAEYLPTEKAGGFTGDPR